MSKEQSITITVRGRPAPQGSKRYIGRGRMIEASRHVAQWRADVIAQVRPEHRLRIDEPVQMSIVFSMPRPQRRKNGQYHATRPDLTKLIRATEDALVDAGVLADDSRIACISAAKVYGDETGALIEIAHLGR